MKKITPFLWFDGNVAEAMDLYRSVFPAARVTNVVPGPGGRMSSATFDLEGQSFIAFDGGPHYLFTPAFSLYVNCETQEEVDEIWSKLTEGGVEHRCGWLVDRFGLSWQVVPSILPRLLRDPDPERARRARDAMLEMVRIDIAALEQAVAGAVSP